MKFSWGTGIFLFFVVFLTLAGFFLVFAFSKDVNLVHEQYYLKGVNYSHQMEIDKRSEPYKNTIYFENTVNELKVFFPDDFLSKIDSGNIHFFRPSDRFLDAEFKMNKDKNFQILDKTKISRGRYLVQFSWTTEAVEYFLEKELLIK